METVHRHDDMCVGVFGGEPCSECRLAGAGWADDPDHPSHVDLSRLHTAILPTVRGLPCSEYSHAPMSSIYELEMTSITGEQVDFDQFRGQVLLIVNVASA